MSDKIKVEVELDLSALRRYTVFNDDGEPGYHESPVSITEAVVHAAAQQIMEATKTDVAKEVRELVRKEWAAAITSEVSRKLDEALSAPIVHTDEWGNSVGPATSLGERIKREITSQLTQRPRAGMYDKSVLDRVIAEQVNAALTKDLQAAFFTAREAMLKAAQDAGAAALRAAVTKAVG